MMNRLSTAFLLRNSANRILDLLKFALFPRTNKIISNLKNHPGKILILRTGNIGDTACALPTLKVLRETFPQSHLCLLTSPGPRGLPEAREVLDGLNLVDEIITFYNQDLHNWRFRRALLTDLRGRGFDLFFLLPTLDTDLQRNLRDLLFARLLGIKGALGFVLANSFPGFDLRTLKDYVPPHYEVDRLLLLLAQAGINRSRPFSLDLPASCHRRAEGLLEAYPQDGRPVIGFQVKAKANANQWPLANFSDLGHRLQEAFQPVFVLFGGPGEAEGLNRFASTFPGDKLVAAGKTSVQESLALLARCRAFVTLDTGPMHLAALVNTPTVALFSARQFRKMWEPNSENAKVLRKTVPCELCFQNDCHHLTCMRAISPDEVFTEMTKILSKNNSLPELGVQG